MERGQAYDVHLRWWDRKSGETVERSGRARLIRVHPDLAYFFRFAGESKLVGVTPDEVVSADPA